MAGAPQLWGSAETGRLKQGRGERLSSREESKAKEKGREWRQKRPDARKKMRLARERQKRRARKNCLQKR